MLFLNENIFYFTFFLALLPPIMFFNSILSTQSLVKILLVFIFIYNLISNYRIFFKDIHKYRKITLLVLILFTSQSISVVSAVNILTFLSVYQNYLVSLIFFLLALFYFRRRSLKKISTVLFVSFTINSLIQLFIYFDSYQFLNLGYFFLHKGYMNLIKYNLERARVYYESFNEILIPVFIYWLVYKKDFKKKLLFTGVIFLQSFLTIISGFRTNLLIYMFAFYSTLIILAKNTTKLIAPTLTILLFVFLFIFNKIQIKSVGYTVFQRIFEENIFSRDSTLLARFDYWSRALNMGIAFPLTGVGLGNYFDNLIGLNKKGNYFRQVDFGPVSLANQNPHSIIFATLAETGFFGLITLIILLIYFIRKDIYIIMNENKNLRKIFIISFWSIFIFGLLNPTNILKYQIILWSLRVIIEKKELFLR